MENVLHTFPPPHWAYIMRGVPRIYIYIYIPGPPKDVFFRLSRFFFGRRPKTQLNDTPLALFCVVVALFFTAFASCFQGRRALRQIFRGDTKKTSLQGAGIHIYIYICIYTFLYIYIKSLKSAQRRAFLETSGVSRLAAARFSSLAPSAGLKLALNAQASCQNAIWLWVKHGCPF